MECYDFQGDHIPNVVLKTSHEAKLKELLRNITSIELKLCSDASKEFIKLLKGETGAELLHEYIHTSSKCVELLEAWKLRQGKPGFHYILSLVSAILNHPDGKYKAQNTGGTATSRALDKFARLILEEKLGDIYKELNAKEVKNRNSALRLLASIVKRGSVLASDVAKNFDFKLPIFPKLAEYQKKRQKHSTRRSFIGLAMSFLEVGKPGLLRWVIQQKEMFSNILRGLGSDDDDVVFNVLSTLMERVLTPESLVPPGLRSVLFGSVTLEQLVLISGRENGFAAEIAHKVLLIVCTDPSNGLMPDLKRNPNPLRGNTKRLLDLMKKLKATDIGYHRDLLLAIVSGRPSFGSAYLDEFPYNLEDHTSLNWSAAAFLAAKLISSVGAAVSFGFLDSQPQGQLTTHCPDVQSIIKCICPRPFTRLVINKGLLHSNSIVKHGTLRLVLETLKLLDSFIDALNNTSHSSVKQEILNEVRVLLPDPQVLLSLLSSLNGRYKSPNLRLKRGPASETVLEDNMNAYKKMKTCSVNEEEADIVVGGITDSPVIDLPIENEEALGTNSEDTFSDGVDHIAVIWGLDRCALKDEETYFYAKLLDTLKIYHRTMPVVLEGSFDFFKVLSSSALALPTILQQSILSMLIQHIGWSSSHKIPARNQSLMYRHLYSFITLTICSPIRDVRDQAYVLARASMLSTGAFDNIEREISAWFLFLPGYNSENVSVDMLHMFSSVVSFLCDAVSTVGNNLFRYWDILRSRIYHLKGAKDVSPSFSPLVLAVLEKCLRILNSETGNLSLPDKSMISLYVSNTISYLLQTQVEAGLLSSLVHLILSQRNEDQLSVVDISDDICEWRPLKNLLLFVKSIADEKTCIISSNYREMASIADGSFNSSLDAVKNLVSSGYVDGLSAVTTAFSSSMLCTPPREILQYFPSVVSVSHRLQGIPFPILFSTFYLERDFLIGISKLWPEMFFTGLEMSIGKANEEEMKEYDSTECISSAFCLFLKRSPFYVLCPSIVSTNLSYLLGESKTQDLLLAKLSEEKPDDLISSLSLVLFWFHKIQLSYVLKAVDVLEKLSDMCFVLIEKILAKIFSENIDLKDAQEVAEVVFSHPSVILLLESSNGEFTEEMFGKCFENFTLLAKKGLNQIDRNVLNMLGTTLVHIFASCKRVKAFDLLVQKLFVILKDRFEGCIKPETNLVPLIPTLVTLHDLINFLSPFDLLDIVNWIFSRTGSSRNSALYVGLYIAGCTFDLLPKAIITWEIEDYKNFNFVIFSKILHHLVEVVSHCELDIADLCLLKAINIANTLVQKHCLPFSMVFMRVLMSTPMKTIVSHCTNNRLSLTKSKLLLNLTQMNPQYLSLSGRLLSDLMENTVTTATTTTSEDHFMMLLPTALLYLNSTRLKYGERLYLKNLMNIASFYWRILSSGFSNWKSYLSRNIFQVEFDVLPSSLDEFVDFVNNTLLGKSVLMFRYYFVSTPMKLKKRLKFFDSICPYSAPEDDLLDCHVNDIDAYSSNQCVNFIVKAVAKISVSRMLLFGEGIEVDGGTKEGTSARIRYLNMLVQTWHLIVKKFLLNSSCSLWRVFEVFILRSILDLTAVTRNCFSDLDSLSYIEQFMKSSLLHRFEDDLSIRMLRSVLTISEGKFSPNLVLQLLLAHSQFLPTILSAQISAGSSQFGIIFKPMSSILRSHVLYLPSHNAASAENNLRLEVVKLLRVLFHIKAHQGGYDDASINSRELLLLLLSSYGATLSEVDLEIYSLMHEIESSEELKSGNIAELDYLWGSAAIDSNRRVWELNKDAVSAEGVEERRRNQFRENLPIDPRLCANTVLFFPYDRTIDGNRDSSLRNVEQNNVEPLHEEVHSTILEKRQIYDPLFILRVSIHCLSLGYVEPMEFVSLGLLAIAFVSISSPDYEIRRLAYEVIGRFKSALEMSKKRKDVMRLRLLLTYLQNGIEEAWQRIPSVSSVFVAEASLLLLDPSHDHYSIISKMLVRTPRMNLKIIPLFQEFFWSSSLTFKTDRLWILRLLYAGLNLDDDAHIYIKNSVLEILLSFYASPLSDYEAKELILQIVKKSLKLQKISRHLYENCCLMSWLSSILSFSCGKQYHDQRFFTQLTVVLEVVCDVISSREASEWLLKYGFEQLAELSSQLYKLITGDIKLMEHDVQLVTTILRVLTSTLKISQKRNINQPHYTISIEGLFHICQVVDTLSYGGHSPCSEFGLEAVLMSSPSPAILHMNHEKLLKFVTWALSIALHSKSAPEKHLNTILKNGEEEEKSKEDSIASKLLRWLIASVILGWKYDNSSDSNPHVTLQSLLENVEKGRDENQVQIVSSEEENITIIIGGAILYLQQQLLHEMNSRILLLSSVSALSLVLLNDPIISGSNLFHEDEDHPVASLLCRIHSPAEANPSWKWSFRQPWQDASIEAEDIERMDEIHACQTLLLLFANLLDKKQQHLSLHSQILQDMEDISSVFQWESKSMETLME